MYARTFALLLAVSTAACAAETEIPGDDTASTSQAVTAGTVIGTWDGTNAYAFGGVQSPVWATSLTSAGFAQTAGSVETDSVGFQCVELAMRYFRFRKGIPVWFIPSAIAMCSSFPAGVSLTSSPAPGDLVVLKANDAAIQTGSAGHVAIVTSTSGDTVNTFNENWASDTTAFGHVLRSRDVACFLHAGGGGGGTPTTQCTAAEQANSTAGGLHYWTCQGANRYICDDRGNKITQTCGGGCIGEGVAHDDQCSAQGPFCSSSEQVNATLGSGHYWTCEGGDRYICDDHTNRVAQHCSAGCVGEGVGHDDQCN